MQNIFIFTCRLSGKKLLFYELLTFLQRNLFFRFLCLGFSNLSLMKISLEKTKENYSRLKTPTHVHSHNLSQKCFRKIWAKPTKFLFLFEKHCGWTNIFQNNVVRVSWKLLSIIYVEWIFMENAIPTLIWINLIFSNQLFLFEEYFLVCIIRLLKYFFLAQKKIVM